MAIRKTISAGRHARIVDLPNSVLAMPYYLQDVAPLGPFTSHVPPYVDIFQIGPYQQKIAFRLYSRPVRPDAPLRKKRNNDASPTRTRRIPPPQARRSFAGGNRVRSAGGRKWLRPAGIDRRDENSRAQVNSAGG